MGGPSNSVSPASYAVRLITKSRLPVATDHLDQRHLDSRHAMERHPQDCSLMTGGLERVCCGWFGVLPSTNPQAACVRETNPRFAAERATWTRAFGSVPSTP